MLLMPLLSACISDEIKIPESGPEGIPTRISLDVEVNDASTLTRGIDGNSVHSIWVGIYSKRTGELTGSHYQAANSDDKHIKHPISNLECKSGQSYIVAVANPDAYMGYTPSNPDGTGLLELLQGEQTKTWKGFRSIYVKNANSAAEAIISDPSPGNANPLLMSGHYYNYTDPDTHPADIVTVQDVYVPVAKETPVTMPGAIHLRRLWSEITFNVEPTGNVIELEVNSMRINNVPSTSWLFERNQGNPSADAPEEYANSGDAVSASAGSKEQYPASGLVQRGSMTVSDVAAAADNPAHKKYSYTFYMMENKRTGNDNCASYEWRELEWGQDGQKPDPANAGVATGELSGNFVSLCPTNAPTYDNNATYVDINCDIKYRDGQAINRKANITYRVHLGYINKEAADFNSFRNSRYTYNVKVQDVSKVLVEANRENGEYQPGAFGTITDITEDFHEFDGHYHVFTIQLTTDELADFTWRMDSYDAGNLHTLTEASTINESNSDYWDWVQLVRNTGNSSDPVAYPGAKSTNILYLKDMKGQAGGWFTVFVNEYAYYNTAKTADSDWHRFVNQPARRFWIYTRISTSHDGQSSYYTAKYGGQQESIQSYFGSEATQAIGVERVNESFGMNLRWQNSVEFDGWDTQIGRKNIWNIVGGVETENKKWSTYLNQNRFQNISAIDNTNQKGISDEQRRAKEFKVPSLVNYTGTLSYVGYARYNAQAAFTDPQMNHGDNTQYIDALYACMNRNRDLNGNGNIDKEELRWIVPSSGEMLRLIVGQSLLENPFNDFATNPLYANGISGQNSADLNARFRYITSDARIIWLDQLMSVSGIVEEGSWNPMPWNVRCVRNVGVNWTVTPGTVRIKPAYDTYVDGTTLAIVKPTYFQRLSLREPVNNGVLPMHNLKSDLNRLSRTGFEVYGSDLSGKLPTGYANLESEINSGRICSDLNTTTGRTGWRLPNQVEATVIMRLAEKEAPANNDYFIPSNNERYTTCTQAYYNDDSGSGQDKINTSNRHCCMYLNTGTKVDNGTVKAASGRIMTISGYSSYHKVRCVRDLTDAEYAESFESLAQKFAPTKSVGAKRKVIMRKIVKKTRRR